MSELSLSMYSNHKGSSFLKLEKFWLFLP